MMVYASAYGQTLEGKGGMKDKVVVSYELTLPQNIYPKLDRLIKGLLILFLLSVAFAEETYYRVQLASSENLEDLRVEKIGELYTLRSGFFREKENAERVEKKLSARVNSVRVGVRYFWYNNRNFEDRELFTEVSLENLLNGSLIGGVRLVNRFRKDNTQIYGEYYRRLAKAWWGYVSGDLSPNATFVPVYSIGAGAFRTMGGYELGSSFRYMRFRNSDVFLLIPSAVIYLPKDFYHSISLYLNPQRGTLSLVNRLTYRGSRLRGFASFSLGTSSEQLQEGEDFTRYSTFSSSAGLEYRISERVSLGGSVRLENIEGLYRRYGVEVYGRLWW